MSLLTGVMAGMVDFWRGGVLSPADEALMRATQQVEGLRLATMARARRAYSGNVGSALKVDAAAGEPDYNVAVNRIAAIVDTTVFYLFGQVPGWTLPDHAHGSEPPTTPAETEGAEAGPDPGAAPDPCAAALEECLRRTAWPSVALDWAHNGALTGTGYLGIRPAAPGTTYPRVQALDPESMTITTDPRDIDDVVGYTQLFDAGPDPATKKPTLVRKTIRKVVSPGGAVDWQIVDEHRVGGGPWVPDGDELWGYPWPPILHCKNLPNPGSPYGRPDVPDDLIDLQLATNRVLTNRNKILYLHGHPQVWATGVTANMIVWGPGQIIVLPAAESKIGQLVPAVTGAEAADLGREFYEAMTEQSSTPAVVLGRATPQADPSGVALQIEFGPLLRKTDVKRTLYGPAVIELFRRLLELMHDDPTLAPTLAWPEIVPQSPLLERQAYQIDDTQGWASKATIAAKLGYEADEEAAQIGAERAANPPPPPVAVPTPMPAGMGDAGAGEA